MPRSLPRVFLALVLLLILGATLYPAFGDESEPLTLCVLCGEHGGADALANLLLFLPFGAALTLCGWPTRWALLAAAGLSAGIECAQLIIPGRDPSLGDVIFNTLGGAAGVGLVRTARTWLLATAPRAHTLLAAVTLTVAGVLAGTAFVLQPELPNSRYFGQWTPNLGHLVWYRARVLSASLGGMALPPHRLADSATVRELLLGGSPLTVRAVAGPPTGGIGSLFSIYDDRQREIALLGPDRADLVFRLRTGAARLRLDEPDLRLLGAMRGVRRGDTITVQLRHQSDGWCLALDAHSTCRLGFTLGRAWALLLYPESFPQWLRRLLDAGWMAGLLLPVGFFATRAGGGASMAALILLVAGITGLPAATGLKPTTFLELAGALGGVAMGALLSRAAASLHLASG